MLYLDNIVGKLLDVDRQARQILDEAQQYYDKTLEEISAERREIGENYDRKAHKHLEDVRASETLGAEDRVRAIGELYAERTRALEEIYEKKHQLWEDALFARVTGGER